jgi:ATP-binding cassette subfamily B protein
VDLRDWRALAAHVRPHRRVVAALAVVLFVSIALQVATPQVVRTFIDRALDPDERSMVAISVLYVAAVVLQQGFRLVSVWLSEVVGWLTTNDLRAELMEHCLALDPDFHEATSPGELIERVDGDLNGLSIFFGELFLTVIGNALLLVGVLIVVWFQQPLAAAAMTVLVVIAVLSFYGVRRIAAGAWGVQREASATLYGYLEERLSATVDVRSCAAENHTLRGLYERTTDRIRTTTRARFLDGFTWLVNGLLTASAMAISFVVPVILLRRGQITVGGAFVLYFYGQLLIQPILNVSQQVEQLQQAIAGGRRVIQLLQVAPHVVDGPGAVVPDGPLEVRFDRVTFGYGSDPDVLHDVSLHVPAGSVLGVVGRTGSGKSTIARLLVRLHDVRTGSVSVGGVDVRTPTKAQLRGRVALVTQEVHVLRASVRDNLTLFDESIDDARILDAIAQLGLGPWFAALPDGLDTIVREGGAGLSAGESQLLSFGRAFLADPAVVILDEASSRLDPATEAVLESAVDALLAGRTGIVIAHRLSTLDRCDAIAVLDHGHVVEHGSRDALAGDVSTRFGALLQVR